MHAFRSLFRPRSRPRFITARRRVGRGGLHHEGLEQRLALTASYIYGVDDTNDIWQINPEPGDQTFVDIYNTGLTNQSNAFAFDRDRDQMFFLNRGAGTPAPLENNLWMWNKPLDTFVQIATGTDLGISGITIPANAAYYADAFWFFKEGTFQLVKAALVYGSAAPGTVPTLGSVETFTVTPTPSPSFSNSFGDIAINPVTGLLYASTSQGAGGNFYSLDLNTASAGTVGGFTMLKQGTIDPTTSQVIGMQIAFNGDYTVLYGHNYNDGKWFSIDTTNGTLTDLNFATLVGNTNRGFRDIGGASIVTVVSADVAVTKTVDDATPNVGDTIAYTITVSNDGPDGATGVELIDTFPASELQFVSATPSTGTYDQETGLWTIGSLANGASVTLTITALVLAPATQGAVPGTQTNVVEVTANEPDPDPDNNRAEVDETPQYADLAVTKTVDEAAPNVGDDVTFTITLSNLGVDAATSVTLADLLPAGLQFVSATPSQGAYASGTGVWTVGTVAANASATLAVVATVLAPSTPGAAPQPITNTAAVATSDQYDPDPDNNEDDVTVTPQYADLAVTKTVNEAAPNVGDDVTFTITLSNLGVDAATSVTLSDLLPAGLQFVSATPSQGAYASGTGVWTVGTVAANASVTLAVVATVLAPSTPGAAPQPITNTAAVATSDQYDPDPDNNEDDVTVTPQYADLAVTKTVDEAAPFIDDTITYTIVVNNLGIDTAQNVTVAETFPVSGLADIVAGTPTQGSYDPSTQVWTVGSLTSGATATLTFTARVIAVGELVNQATATSTTYDPDPDNNTGEAEIVVGSNGVITGTDFGCNSGPIVRVVDPRDGTLRAEFLAYEPSFRGGVRVFGADVTGDGIPEILTAPGPGRAGEIRVFDRNGTPLPEYTFFPFGAAYRSGVEVAAGSVTGPGRSEIVAAQSRGQSLVRVFTVNPGSGVAGAAVRQFQPFGPRYRGGVTVATADVGTFSGRTSVATVGDGIAEIIVGSGAGIPAEVRAYSAVPRPPAAVGGFRALGGANRGVSVSKLPGAAGAADRILVAGGQRSGGQVETWRHTGSRFVRDAAFAAFGGTNAAVFAAALDADNIFTVEGIGGRTSGIRKNTSPSGGTASQVPQTSAFRPPLRVSVLGR